MIMFLVTSSVMQINLRRFTLKDFFYSIRRSRLTLFTSILLIDMVFYMVYISFERACLKLIDVFFLC